MLLWNMSAKTTIWIMCGPPCSGKSTYAKELAKGKDCIRVNRDELRIMIKGHYVCNNTIAEKIINKLIHIMIDEAILNNQDIVVDATHCKFSYMKDILDSYGTICPFKVVLFDVPTWKLKMRNVLRYMKTGIWIPTKVIDNMVKNFKLLDTYLADNLKPYKEKNAKILIHYKDSDQI